ncbi:MAG: TIGR03086 family protein [Acidimicrobiales bacterium]|nr:TIGR03086 family protein [Acidimicrobiales bacterium]RZV42947.1 MAG: TIGR03086 family protein [Acidimicrobiales bacterium]
MDVFEAFSQSRQEFETRLRQVGDDQWDLPTPCPDWSVRDLVNHMLLGTRMSVQLLAGASRDEVLAGLNDDLVTDDPVGDFVALADQMEAGFAAPGGLEGTVNHPMGEIPRQMFLGFRMTDNAVHGWDLARAIGVDDQFDETLAEQMWENAKPNAAMLAGSGVFGDGASGDVDEGASNQAKLLDALGRRP